RAFAQAGKRVWAADSLRCTAAGFSQFASGFVFLPPPALDYDGFRKAVLSAVRELQIQMVVPTSEEIFFLARFQVELQAVGAVLFSPPLSTLRALHSKFAVQEWCAACGVRLPRTLRASSAAELCAAVA